MQIVDAATEGQFDESGQQEKDEVEDGKERIPPSTHKHCMYYVVSQLMKLRISKIGCLTAI